MTLEQRMQRRLQEYRRMAGSYRAAEQECRYRANNAYITSDEKARDDNEQEAEINKAEAMAYERVCADLAHDLAARAVRPKRRKALPDDLVVEVPF